MPVTPPGKVQFNVYLPIELVTQIKHAAIDAHLSLSSYAEQLFVAHLHDQGQEPR